MNAEELKRRYGDEYPLAVVTNGVRMPLKKERRFSRYFFSAENKMGTIISRFMDGSASFTFEQLEKEWPGWSEDERWDFCNACCWLNKQPDFAEMMRFVMRCGNPDDWSAVALPVAGALPQQEAFDVLVEKLRRVKIGKRSNVAQAIAHTKHPAAAAILREHLAELWKNEFLWEDDKFTNWIAFTATTCIENLIEIGASPAEFEEQVRQLSAHVCSGTRDSCRNFLGKHYPWLKTRSLS